MPDTEAGYFLDKNELYFTATDMGAHEDEYGNIITSNVGGKQFLCSINLETGAYINYGSIYDGDEQYDDASRSHYASIKGAYDGKIYLMYSFLKETIPEDMITPEYDGYVWLSFEFDLETKTLTESELPSPVYADFNSYVGYDCQAQKLVVIDGENRHEIKCDTKIYTASVINGRLFVMNEQKWYDLSDLSEHSMGEYGEYVVIAYYNNCYILVNGSKTVKLTEEELLTL